MSGVFLGCVLVTSIEVTHLLRDPRVSIKLRVHFISLVREKQKQQVKSENYER